MSIAADTPVSALDEALLARIEDAGINASAPRQQLWVDGWLIRLSPGKARRARCIQAVASGRLPVDEKLARCLPLYAAAGLRLFVRVTPFSQPAGLDDRLAELGMDKIDETRVMVLASLASQVGVDVGRPVPRFATADAESLAEWVGLARGSSAIERRSHAERIAGSPVRHHSVLALDVDGTPIGCGQVVTEGDVAGLYDVFTAESQRGRGVAESLCRHLLAFAATAGARIGYLQVDAANEPARRLYGRMGFVDGYSYHYRSPPGSEP